ncbi:MAG: hypothetical protein SFV15_14565 [Polyangiaceae bacterium]|nr:hypothetical protein [Polyangiaceae bacterium]
MHALRFLPPNHGHWVPARAYVQVIDLIIEGLYKVCHHAAPRIADATGQPKELVRDALEFAIGTAEPGIDALLGCQGEPIGRVLGQWRRCFRWSGPDRSRGWK